ncbi:telomere zinc finger-associated protein [Thalassophryne amazonica]|uniref:telomere zinc finger-associated protein n=1 Tax=Thalassophryne amazonica TaxID=390379 RepID=UPI001470CF0C|nr:telomere zinc finger-associated protein [Thalassophryne amazonica]XP_034029313.1 telomere zinc finger-associated protein [Thalassophryne amazonica]XP_034029315.1 telomere zinc finger-associated protein [Thalassophryne amazonica]
MSAANNNHAQRVLSSLNQQREVGTFCDAILKVGGEQVHLAHRNILACFSHIFQGTSTPTEPHMEISLKECPSDGLELLLNFVYTGELKLELQNVDKVQHAAASLCIQEALVLCQQFQEARVDPVPVKHKSGRPKKSTLDCKVKEENTTAATKDEPGFDTFTDISIGAMTTTRSGRVVKGPRQLAGDSTTEDFTPTDHTSKETMPVPIEKESEDVGECQSPYHSNDDLKIIELQIDLSDNSVNQVNEEEENGDAGDAWDFEGLGNDSSEEYEPVAQTSSDAPSASTAWRKNTQNKVEKQDNVENVEQNPKKGSVQCPICDKSFRSKYYLKVHNRRHTGEKPFVCLKCGKKYFRKENLLEHESKNCARVQKYSCQTCSSTFNKRQELRLHIISHTGDLPNKCSFCPGQFMHKRDLMAHMIKVHGFPKPHACEQCAKSFVTRTELRIHEASKHRGERPFVCEECGHRASSRNGLQMHIKAIHRNERPFVCSVCGHAFTQKTNLNMHLRIHTGERPYQCHLCGKTFRTQASLDKHHRTHTGERPFSCEFCEQRFTEKGPLVRHIASKHQEGRPHCCAICSKTFKAIEQLRVHLRRHKGMRKFECTDCGYKFTRQAHLRRHSQIHKRSENYNPRQRKLRNIIVEGDGSTGEKDVNESMHAPLSSDDTDCEPERSVDHESSNQGSALVSAVKAEHRVMVAIEQSDPLTVPTLSDQNPKCVKTV